MDGHLSSLKEYQAQAEAAKNTIEQLTAEQQRLKRRLAQQQDKVTSLTGELDEQHQLMDALKARKEHHAGGRQPQTPGGAERPEKHSTMQVDELKQKLVQAKADHTERIKQKNVLIQTLRRQLKGVSDKLVEAETDRTIAKTVAT